MWSLWECSGGTNSNEYWIGAGVITGFALLTVLVTKFCACMISRVLYYMLAVWWGFEVYAIFWAAIYHIVDSIEPLSTTSGMILILVPSGIICVYGLINARCLKLEEIDIKVKGVKEPLKIVHISDLHLGPIYHRSYVSKVVKRISILNPDFVVISGDLFDGSMKLTPDMVEPFNKLSMKVFFALGNHDIAVSGTDEVMNALADSNIILLRNEMVSIQGINLIGLDYSREKKFLETQLNKLNLNTEKPNILLYHVPEKTVDELEKLKINIQLAGHTHAGQMIPFHIQALVLYQYLSGLHTNENSYVYVSPGTGTAGPPMRVGSSSTITLITIHP